MASDRENQLVERNRMLEERVQMLEEINSALQDKLDAIYQIVAPEDFEAVLDDEDDENLEETAEAAGLVNIDIPGQRKQ